MLDYLFSCVGWKIRRDRAPQEDTNPDIFGGRGLDQETSDSSQSRPTSTYSIPPQKPEVMHIQTFRDPGASGVRGLNQEMPKSVESSKIPPKQGFSTMPRLTPRKPRESEFDLDVAPAKPLRWNDLIKSERSFFYI